MGYNLFLTIGALLLFGTLLVSTQNLISYSESDSLGNEYILAAYGAAQTVIDEAKTKSFDENTVSTAVADTSGLTPAGALGSDGGGELVPLPDTMVTYSPYTTSYPGYPASVRFDDVDDYNGYSRLIRASRGFEGDTVRVSVVYVPLGDPDGGPVGSRSMCKKMTVKVTGKYLPGSVILSYAFTY